MGCIADNPLNPIFLILFAKFYNPSEFLIFVYGENIPWIYKALQFKANIFEGTCNY